MNFTDFKNFKKYNNFVNFVRFFSSLFPPWKMGEKKNHPREEDTMHMKAWGRWSFKKHAYKHINIQFNYVHRGVGIESYFC